MKRILTTIFSVLAFVVLCSHDMFLKFDSYFLEPNTQAVLQLYNGTFTKSDNVIDRDRMLDVSLVGNGNRIKVDSSQWFEKDSITFLNFKTGQPGTWVAGVSTAARDIELKAEDFNKYLENDGVLDVLENRKTTNTLNTDAVEKYAKHVKSIFQVGEERSNDWNTNLGYPIEFIPLQNPYNRHEGHKLEFRLLYNGTPLPNQLVYVGRPAKGNASEVHSHDNEEKKSHTHNNEEASDHEHDVTEQFRTDENGIVSVDIDTQGIWFLRSIHMVASKEEGLTHESNWATLTFAVGSGNEENHTHGDEEHEHGSDTHTHDDESQDHDHEDDGFPTIIFWLGSILMVAALFYWFNRKK